MKYLLLFIAAFSCAFADSYTVYVVRSTPGLFEGASASEVISRLKGSDVVVEVCAETEGNSSGYIRTHQVEFTAAWDDAGKPTSKGSQEVGTKFLVTEEGDKVSFQFSHTTLDRWVSQSTSKTQFQPLFQTRSTNSRIVLKKGASVVASGNVADEINTGGSGKLARYVVIERK